VKGQIKDEKCVEKRMQSKPAKKILVVETIICSPPFNRNSINRLDSIFFESGSSRTVGLNADSSLSNRLLCPARLPGHIITTIPFTLLIIIILNARTFIHSFDSSIDGFVRCALCLESMQPSGSAVPTK
jgi:hypothetical protein